MAKRGADSRLIVGLIFLILGAYFLLNNFNLIPFELPDFITSWQVFLILIGLVLLTSRERRAGGATLVVVGAVFLLPELFDVSVGEVIRQFWPLALVAIGAVLLFRRSQEKKTADYLSEQETADYLDETAVLGSVDRLVSSPNFRGGKITSILGSGEFNFINAHQASGGHVLDLFIFFGNTELTVPQDWNVRVEVTPILGSFEDRRRQKHTVGDGGEQLTIKGLILFGSGELLSI